VLEIIQKKLKEKQFALEHVKTFSLGGTLFPCGAEPACLQASLLAQKGFLELQAEQEVLTVGRAAEHGSVQ
jgi:hypothetical protein